MTSSPRHELTSIFNSALKHLRRRNVRVVRELGRRELPRLPKPLKLSQLFARLDNGSEIVTAGRRLILPGDGKEWSGAMLVVYRSAKDATPDRRALRVFEALVEAARVGLPVVLPYTVLEIQGKKTRYSIVVTQAPVSGTTLSAVIGVPVRRQRRRMARALGVLLGRLHDANAVPRKLHAREIAFGEGERNELRAVLLTAANIGYVPASFELCARSLANLFVVVASMASRADCLCMLHAYAGQRGIERRIARSLMQRAAILVPAMLREQAVRRVKRGGVVAHLPLVDADSHAVQVFTLLASKQLASSVRISIMRQLGRLAWLMERSGALPVGDETWLAKVVVEMMPGHARIALQETLAHGAKEQKQGTAMAGLLKELSPGRSRAACGHAISGYVGAAKYGRPRSERKAFVRELLAKAALVQ